MLLDGNTINPLVAFTGGLITFFASCLLPLVPTYLAYITGSALQDEQQTYQRWKVFRHALFFVAGFILTFILLGLSLNQFSAAFQPYRVILEKLGGMLFILFGLFLTGVIKSGWLQREFKFNFGSWFERWPYLNAFLFGLVFSIGWTPCIGPILAVILLWSTQQATMLNGIFLLFMYGLGLGLPFLVTALLFETIMPWWQRSKYLSLRARQIAGIMIIISGLLILSDQFQNFSFWLVRLINLTSHTV